MKAGTRVRISPPPIDGVVVEQRVNPVTDDLESLVAWDEGGQRVQRWFDDDQLTKVEVQS